MADIDINPNFGAELKDGFKPVNAWVANGIGWLDEIQQFYRERAAIEREYAGKLSALAKKYFEKKAKKSSTLSVGENPTVTPGSLECASMTTWQVQLTTLESRASEHEQFSQQLVTNLAEPLKQLAARYEELRKYHGDYAAKLEKERESTYSDLRKMKGKYDNSCQEVENRRKKSDGAFDHGKAKARAAFEQQQADMRNVKSTYIISINVTNKQKERYYHEYVPELLDSLQDLSESRVGKLNQIWSLAAQIETGTLARSTEFLNHLASEIPRNNPKLDSMMFVRHNVQDWHDPPDFVFEPSPVWHDDDTIPSDETTKIFLTNILTKSKGSLGELKHQVDAKARAVENARRERDLIRGGKKGDEVECVRAIFTLQEQKHEVERQKTTAEVEVSTITTAVGDVSIGARNHNFKAQTFKIPTNCDLCGDRIWGLSAKGFDCQDCGYTCHSKCEMKVPADCPGEMSKEEKKRLKARRQEDAKASTASLGTTESQSDLPQLSRSDTVNSMNTLSSGYSATAHRSISGTAEPAEEKKLEKKSSIAAIRKNRIMAPPPAQYIKPSESDGPSNGDSHKSNEPKGKMMYAYSATGEGEISVDDGKEVAILEPDDGSGWMKVRTGHEEGLVPASYVEALPASPGRPSSTYSNSTASIADSIAAVAAKKKGPAVAPKRGAKKLKYAEALYDYEARSDAEHTIVEGERFVLINKDAGDGWADVEKGGITKSVPANYIQEV
ncbi:Fps/Fes/Fer/CIP4-like protein [Botryosphaeria dothidea]|uniref:Protein BZZ1 n=1 Tax=Botryosphaeria dothidea TaxID=55169 RepID=A0A8H4J671_9PEZI|nr:Fps/Fes/Fer/CIP4-like protein [Botryosphaeria dothidea]